MNDFYLSPLYPSTIQKGTEVDREKNDVGDQDGGYVISDLKLILLVSNCFQLIVLPNLQL